jgi:valine--pyruvate aminotransferase
MSQLTGIRSIMDDIARTTGDPGAEVCNLSPGNPAHLPEVVATWQRLGQDMLDEQFVELGTRYGPSRGAPVLVDAVVDYFAEKYRWPIGAENVVVGPGSQMLAFTLTTLFTGTEQDGPRRLVLPRTPDYTGFLGLSLDADSVVGVEPLVVEDGERRFHYAVDTAAVERRTDIGMMLVSNPANPSGSTLTAVELAALIDIAVRKDVPLVVDNAYGSPFPSIVHCPAPPVFHPNVVNLFTFSKAGIPGLRVGFAIGAAHLVDAVVSCLANSVLHTAQPAQGVAARALTGGVLDGLVEQHIRPHYRATLETAERVVTHLLPAKMNWRMHSGDGGLFCWLIVDHDWFDDLTLYEMLKRSRTFVVPGRHFFVGPMNTPFLSTHGRRCVRLSLTYGEPALVEGVRRMREALERMSTIAVGAS